MFGSSDPRPESVPCRPASRRTMLGRPRLRWYLALPRRKPHRSLHVPGWRARSEICQPNSEICQRFLKIIYSSFPQLFLYIRIFSSTSRFLYSTFTQDFLNIHMFSSTRTSFVTAFGLVPERLLNVAEVLSPPRRPGTVKPRVTKQELSKS